MVRDFGAASALRHYNSRGQLFDVRLGTDSGAVNYGPNPAQWTGASWNRGALRMFFGGNLTEYASEGWTGGGCKPCVILPLGRLPTSKGSVTHRSVLSA